MIARQAASFVLVGLAVNASLYAAYLLLTHTLVDSFAAMTATYCSGVVMGFLLNRRFTFGFEGERAAAFLRYVGAYVFGYLVNFAGLWFLVDRCRIPHEVVQGLIILGVSVLLFFLQKHWVFRIRASDSSPRLARPAQ
jgi:putative flippase GtrA